MSFRAALFATSVFSLISIPPGLIASEWHLAPPPLGSDSNPGTEEKPFETIQKGIDTAAHGDTVIVAKGIYYENIRFGGKNILLRSARPLDQVAVEDTIIDGNKAGSVVTFDGTESEDCVLSGFTIRNGSAYKGGGICGGGFENDTRATIQNNVITDNWAQRYGGGLFRCDGLIENNTISGNSCTLGGPWGGGGLCDCDGTIQNNTITGNSADRGGGLAYCNATIQNNVITGNSAPGYHSEGGGLVFCGGTIRNNTISCNSASGCGGGVMWCDGPIQDNSISGNSADFGGGLYACDGTIGNNLITGNSANYHGGGLAHCDGTIRNNTIFGNSANYHGGGLHGCDGTIQNNKVSGNSADFGGGLYECNDTIRNNTVTDNSARSFGGGLFRCNGATQNNTIARNSAGRKGGGIYDCRGTIHNSIIWGNTAPKGPQVYGLGEPTYSCIQDWTAGGEGNISRDPRFVDPDGPDDDPEAREDNDHRLAEGSPCVDAGKNEDWMWATVDLDRRPRILYGTSSLTVDIGAYEYWPKGLVQCHIERGEMNYATGTFFVPISVTGLACPSPGALLIWLVVTDIVFAVPGPKSEGRLWNADGISSERYLGTGDYYYSDISDSMPADPGETYETMLEFYIKDRNPKFEPVIELWAFRPVTNPDQDSPGSSTAPHADDLRDGEENFGGNVPMARQSYFQIKRVASAPDGAILLQWDSESGVVFVVEAADSPMGPWMRISDHIQSLVSLAQRVDSPPRNIKRRFYRIRLVLEGEDMHRGGP